MKTCKRIAKSQMDYVKRRSRMFWLEQKFSVKYDGFQKVIEGILLKV